jgi:murein DD-endopeptidase MepM/ murein hydrolase activator NlpD
MKILLKLINKFFIKRVIIISSETSTSFINITKSFQILFVFITLLCYYFCIKNLILYFDKYNIKKVATENYKLKILNNRINNNLSLIEKDLNAFYIFIGKDTNSFASEKNQHAFKDNKEFFLVSKMNSLKNDLLHVEQKYISILKNLNFIDNKQVQENAQSLEKRLNNISYYKNLFDIIPFGLPGKTAVITSRFGIRVHPIIGHKHFHKGVDLFIQDNKVLSTQAGKVVRTEKTLGFGNVIEIESIKDNNTIKTRYAHLKSLNVKIGQKILQGDLIGIQGKTGLATAPHVHYEVMLNNKVINPQNILYFAKSDLTFDKLSKFAVK